MVGTAFKLKKSNVVDCNKFSRIRESDSWKGLE